jgi:hypothetical protein
MYVCVGVFLRVCGGFVCVGIDVCVCGVCLLCGVCVFMCVYVFVFVYMFPVCVSVCMCSLMYPARNAHEHCHSWLSDYTIFFPLYLIEGTNFEESF